MSEEVLRSTALYVASRQCLDSGCSSFDGNTRGKVGKEEARGSRAVLIGTEDRGQEEKKEQQRTGETGSPRALQWCTLLNDASRS